MSITNLCTLVPTGDHEMAAPETAVERLRQYVISTRKAAGKTQEQCAKRAGMPLSTWGTIESQRGTMPGPETLIAIAKGLEVPVLYLMRVIEGKPIGMDPRDDIIGPLMADLSEDSKRMVIEWLLMPEDQRRVVEAGLSGLLFAMKRRDGP